MSNGDTHTYTLRRVEDFTVGDRLIEPILGQVVTVTGIRRTNCNLRECAGAMIRLNFDISRPPGITVEGHHELKAVL